VTIAGISGVGDIDGNGVMEIETSAESAAASGAGAAGGAGATRTYGTVGMDGMTIVVAPPCGDVHTCPHDVAGLFATNALSCLV